MRTGDILATDPLAALIPRNKKGEIPASTQFGQWLKEREGRYVGAYKVVSVRDDHTKQKSWSARKYEEGGSK